MKLSNRLAALERSSNSQPMLTIAVEGTPTAEQAALIDRCVRTGRRLIAFFNPGDTLWMTGSDMPPPWGVENGNA